MLRVARRLDLLVAPPCRIGSVGRATHVRRPLVKSLVDVKSRIHIDNAVHLRPLKEKFALSQNVQFIGCPMVTRIACHGMRKFYIEHHFQRYEETLNNLEYRAVLKLGAEDVHRELESLGQKQRALQQCAVVGLTELGFELKL